MGARGIAMKLPKKFNFSYGVDQLGSNYSKALSKRIAMNWIIAQTNAPPPLEIWPFVCLMVGIVTVVLSIAWLRIHAFLALMIAAMLVGVLSLFGTGGASDVSAWIAAVEQPMTEFGSTAGKIAWVIALASLIGVCMMESGAADKIVRVMIRRFGEAKAAWALLICGFILGIPVFFDTVFFLLIPLARGLSLRTGRHYALYIMAICSGAVITHTLVPPTPGPLFMAEKLGIHLATGIWAGILLGIPVAIVALAVARIMDQRTSIPLRNESDQTAQEKGDSRLPSFLGSLAPVALPVLLIGTASVIDAFNLSATMGVWSNLFVFLGNKYIAMLLATLVAMIVLIRQNPMNRSKFAEIMGAPLETAGLIILITAAGGAFGAMIKLAGIGEAIGGLSSRLGLSYILLAYFIAALMKTAQGSGTVSMITTTGMMASVIGDNAALAYHPIYIYLAIGCGSGMISWMNDSGFWVVCKLSGMTEKETLKTWTLSLAVISIAGLILTLLASAILPMKG